MHVKDKVLTQAWVAWADNAPSTIDSSPVKVMRDAGAILFGRTTMPQTGMALETVSNLWGRTLNPYNSAFGCGGSSGGDGALCSLRGEPAAPITTDIGGSIRIPGAVNGLYAMRPTADRVPRAGMVHVAQGNVSIKSAAGPCSHSLEDIKLFTRLILTHPSLPFEPTTIPGSWNEAPPMPPRLRIAVMYSDGVVDPHPPVQRALRETASKLRAAGHEVFEFARPFDFWEAALTTWALYFQTGAKEFFDTLTKGGEPPISQFAHNYEVFQAKALSASEVLKYNVQQAGFKAAFQEAWDAQQIDCLICPVSPMACQPHDFPVWWGYTTIWNMLDYPSIVVPMKDFKINETDDPKDTTYKARDNPFDARNWDICKLRSLSCSRILLTFCRVDDPNLWQTQPVAIQIVGRPYRDEALIATCEKLDAILNGQPIQSSLPS